MGLISKTGDLFYAFRFLRLLTTPWDKTEAFNLGIVDKEGKTLKKAATLTSEEKGAYTVFHRLVFNLKRLLNKLPFGKSKLGSYAAALFLIKEETGMTEAQIKKVMSKVLDEEEMETLDESTWFQTDSKLNPGTYSLTNDICSITTGEVIALTKSKIKIAEALDPVDNVFGQNIYEAYHPLTNQMVYVTIRDIKR